MNMTVCGKKEAVGADGGPIPPAANRFGSSVYGSANCCRTTRFGNIIALARRRFIRSDCRFASLTDDQVL